MTGKQYTNPDLLDGAKEAAKKAAKKLFKLGIPYRDNCISSVCQR